MHLAVSCLMPSQGIVMLENETPPESRSVARQAHAQRPRRNHFVDLRASVPFLGARYYVVILMGRELRHRSRLDAEGQTHWLRQALVFALLLALVVSTAVGCIVIVYIIKCALGINMFAGESPLHFVYERVFG